VGKRLKTGDDKNIEMVSIVGTALREVASIFGQNRGANKVGPGNLNQFYAAKA